MGWSAYRLLPSLTQSLAQGVASKSDAGSCKNIAETEAHDGNAKNSRVSSGPDERDIGDEGCNGRPAERTESPRVV